MERRTRKKRVYGKPYLGFQTSFRLETRYKGADS